jgi:hypothetical protein
MPAAVPVAVAVAVAGRRDQLTSLLVGATLSSSRDHSISAEQ